MYLEFPFAPLPCLLFFFFLSNTCLLFYGRFFFFFFERILWQIGRQRLACLLHGLCRTRPLINSAAHKATTEPTAHRHTRFVPNTPNQNLARFVPQSPPIANRRTGGEARKSEGQYRGRQEAVRREAAEPATRFRSPSLL